MKNYYDNDVVLFCKSYRGDIDRAKVLYESIKKYNKNNLPFYFQIPKSDYKLWKEKIGEDGYNVVFDEDVTNLVNTQSHFTQQLYKMEFYKTKIAKYYVILDSDMYFIRDFFKTDFITEDGIPYLVMHEDKSWRELSINIKGSHLLSEWWEKDRAPIKEYFQRKGRTYGFSGSALIYHSEAIRTLYEELCKPNNITFLDLLKYRAKENCWIGEWILFKGFKFYPIEPMFKTFTYPFQYTLSKKLGHTEETYSKLYLGLVMQSNWNAPLKY